MKKRMMFLFLVVALSMFFLTSCVGTNKAQNGAILGTVVGALVGQAIGHDTAGTLIGTAVGGTLGYVIGNEMDKADRSRLQGVYETTPSHERITWVNPDNGHHYAVTPRPAYRDQTGRDCREAEVLVTINGKAEKMVQTACRENGRWTQQ